MIQVNLIELKDIYKLHGELMSHNNTLSLDVCASVHVFVFVCIFICNQ